MGKYLALGHGARTSLHLVRHFYMGFPPLPYYHPANMTTLL